MAGMLNCSVLMAGAAGAIDRFTGYPEEPAQDGLGNGESLIWFVF
jgi:hypothetical protein